MRPRVPGRADTGDTGSLLAFLKLLDAGVADLLCGLVAPLTPARHASLQAESPINSRYE